MKALLRISGLALALLAPATAHANWFGPPITIDTGVNARFNVHVHDVSAQWHLQPWYTYFPYEAHFQATAPLAPAYPNWPPRMSSSTQPQEQKQTQPPAGQEQNTPPSGLVPPVPPPAPGSGPNMSWGVQPPQPVYQPVGYYYQPPVYPQVPSYWYGR